jgi:hypothetical protein
MNKDAQRYDFLKLNPFSQNKLFAQALRANNMRGEDARVSDQQLIKSGFSSDGVQVHIETNSQEKLGVFAKTTSAKRGEDNSAFFRETVKAAKKDLVGIPPVYGVFGVLPSGELTEVSGDESDGVLNDLVTLITVCQLIDPVHYIPLVDLMKQFGIRTIQTGETESHTWFTLENLEALYHTITDQMVAIHADRSRLPQDLFDQKEAYREGITHVITSRERFDTIHAIGQTIPPVVELISSHQAGHLREGMVHLVEKYVKYAPERIAPIHGDAWMANRLVGPQGDSWLIDPAPMPFGDPAYDVVFGYADLVFTQINRNDGEKFEGKFTDIAEELLQEYIQKSGDTQVRKFMALFYGYKAFVSAVFDAGENQQQRMHLFCSALGAVELAQQNNFEFSFRDLDHYAQVGQKIYASLVKRNA